MPSQIPKGATFIWSTSLVEDQTVEIVFYRKTRSVFAMLTASNQAVGCSSLHLELGFLNTLLHSTFSFILSDVLASKKNHGTKYVRFDRSEEKAYTFMCPAFTGVGDSLPVVKVFSGPASASINDLPFSFELTKVQYVTLHVQLAVLLSDSFQDLVFKFDFKRIENEC